MTLQDLIDELSELPVSARTAIVTLRNGEIDDLDILSAVYEGGMVSITCENSDTKTYDDGFNAGLDEARRRLDD